MRLILERQRVVSLLVNDQDLRAGIREGPLKYVPDIDVLARKLEKRKGVKLEDLYSLYLFIVQIPTLIQLLREVAGGGCSDTATIVEDKYIAPFSNLMDDFEGYKQLINKVLDFDALERNPPEFLVSPEWSDELKEIAHRRDSTYNSICDLYESISRSWGSDFDIKCDPDKRRGFVFRVAKKFDKSLRAMKNVQVVQVVTRGVRT